MQSKDLSTELILKELNKYKGQKSTFGLEQYSMPNIQLGTYPTINPKLFLAKMKKLINQGLVTGCTCGCRGDFEITEKGLSVLK